MHSVFFNALFDTVWEYLTDSDEVSFDLPQLDSEVEPPGEDGFRSVGPVGNTFRIVPVLNKEHGVSDFKVIDAEGHIEMSRSRLFRVRTGGCVLIHFAVRWEGVDDAFWEAYKSATVADLENAKRIIEEIGTRREPS